MQQLKLVKGLENELEDIEKRMNHWLATAGVRVISMTCSIAPQSEIGNRTGGLTSSGNASDVVIAILYEKT